MKFSVILIFSLLFLGSFSRPAVARECVDVFAEPPKLVQPLDIAQSYKNNYRASLKGLFSAFEAMSDNVLLLIQTKGHRYPRALVHQGKIYFFKVNKGQRSESKWPRLQDNIIVGEFDRGYYHEVIEKLRSSRTLIVTSQVFYNRAQLEEHPLYSLLPKQDEKVKFSHLPSGTLKKWIKKFAEDQPQLLVKLPISLRRDIPPSKLRNFLSVTVGLVGGLTSILLGYSMFPMDLGVTEGFFFYELAAPSFKYALSGGLVSGLATRYVLKLPDEWMQNLMDRSWLNQVDQFEKTQ